MIETTSSPRAVTFDLRKLSDLSIRSSKRDPAAAIEV
jgi:hypothetical protein